MSRILYILFVLTLVSCTKTEDPTEGVLAIQGVLRTNSVIQRINITEINNDGQLNQMKSGALVEISDGTDAIVLEETSPGIYEYTGFELPIEPLQTYYLKVRVDGKELSSSTVIPPPINITSQSTGEFGVELNTEGQIVYAVEWEFADDYSQLVDLFSIEDLPELIPFVNPIEEFDDLYAFPIPSSSLILKDLNFKYYGQYVLTINLISKDYEDMFFYDLDSGQNDPKEGIDNIEGGEGFFTGISQEQIILNILE